MDTRKMSDEERKRRKAAGFAMAYGAGDKTIAKIMEGTTTITGRVGGAVSAFGASADELKGIADTFAAEREREKQEEMMEAFIALLEKGELDELIVDRWGSLGENQRCKLRLESRARGDWK